MAIGVDEAAGRLAVEPDEEVPADCSQRSVDVVLAELRVAAPSAHVVALLDAMDTSSLSANAAEHYLAVWERVVAWTTARAAEALVLAARASVADEGRVEDSWLARELAAAELTNALGTGVLQVGARLDAALLLERLPGTAALLNAGEITPAHVRVMTQLLDGRPDAVLAAVEERVLPRAPSQTPPQLRRSVMRALVRVDPQVAAEAADAPERRQVVRVPGLGGTTQLVADLPAVEAAEVWLALDAVARTLPTHVDDGAGRPTYVPLSARRADALVVLARRALADPDLPRPQGRAVVVNVVVPADALLALSEEPADLPGHGPLPASVARALATDAGWRRWVTDPVTGHLLDHGTRVYQPPQQLRDLLVAAHPTCVFPGCSLPSARCQLDHLVPFPRDGGAPAPTDGDPPEVGGTTSAANMRPLCTKHHQIKTFHGWTPVAEADRSVTWTDPHGRRHHVPAAVALPDRGG